MTNIFAKISGSKAAKVAALALVLAGGITFISLSIASNQATGTSVNLTITSTGVPPFDPGTLCVHPEDGDRYHVHTVTGTNPFQDTYVFDGAVFHSDESGCEPTVENPSTTGGTVTGKTVFAPGESGTLVATFDTQAFECGRVQYDMAFNKLGDPTIAQGNYSGLFYGIILDYGVDCGVVTPPCQNVSATLTKSNEQVSATTVTGNVVVGLSGANATGTLTVDDIVQPVTDGQSVPYSFVRPPAGQNGYTKTYTLSVYQGAELCATKTVDVYVPPMEPQHEPCVNVTATLVKSNEQVSATAVTGYLVVDMSGANTTGTLTVDDIVQPVTDGQSIAYSIARPAYGQAAVTRTYTLRVYVGNELCATQTVTVVAQPQDPVIEPCEGITGTLTNSNQETTSTEVTGNIIVDFAGTNATATITVEGATSDVIDGQSIAYSITRPAAGSSAVSRTYTLKVYKSGELCVTREVTITAQPQDGGGGGGGGGGRARITRSKTGWNDTKHRDSNQIVADAGNLITYTLTATNTGTRSDRNFVFEDDISDVLELADLVSYDGADYNAARKTLTWDPITVRAKDKVTKTFTVRIKPTIPTGTDCIIENTFGNTHRTAVACPRISGTSTYYVAPKTGAENAVLIALSLMSVAGFAAYQLYRTRTA